MIQTLFGSLEEEKKTGFFDRMKQAVTRTRENLAERIEEVVSFGKEIDANALADLEATLIGADLGSTTTQEVLGKRRDKADRKQIKDVQELKRLLKEELLAILNTANTRPVSKVEGTPEVILVVGVNGTGKTTTIGKLSQVFRSQGKNVLLCAADTFRAAAIDQLEIWGSRTGTEVIKTKPAGDPSPVLFDALQPPVAPKPDYVFVDTRGRHRSTRNLGIAHRDRSDQGQAGRGSLGRAVRRAAGCRRAQGRLCRRRYGGPASYQDQPDVGTRKNAADGGAHYSWSAARNS